MGVERTHPEYDRFAPRWREMRDHIDGTATIKRRGETYLPMPDGMRVEGVDAAANDAYQAYKTRARYPDIVGPTIRSMVGVVHREAAQYDLPLTLEPVRERATIDGMTLESLHRRITRELMGIGRVGLMVDTPEDGGEPRIALYQAEDIINWHETTSGVDLVVVDESEWEMDRATFSWVYVRKHRELAIEDGRYVVRLYRDGERDGEDIVPTRRGGRTLEALPFVFLDTNDLTPAPDEVPLYGLAQIAASIYRMDADYRQALFLIAQPQRWCSGVRQEDVPSVWGAGVVWVLPPKEAQAGILEFTGAGCEAQRKAMLDDFEMAAQFGARLYERQGGQAESGEARKLRHGQETATLATIAQTGAAGLERALRWCAALINATADDVQVRIDTDFLDRTLGAQEMTAIIQAAGAGIISDQTAYEQLQQGGRANAERPWADERDLINGQPDLGGLGR